MEDKPSQAKQLLIISGALVGWFAIIFQFYLMMYARVTSILETIVRFFSFFTILTNILVAFCFATLWLKPISILGQFFKKASTQTAIAVYIAVVGLIYNLVLRFLWVPQGWQHLVDELLHSVMPVWFFIYWLLFVPKQTLQLKNIWPWTLYPLFYCTFILIRGAIAGFYPYPFTNVLQLGYSKVLINCLLVASVVIGFSFLFIGISILINKKQMKNKNY